MTAIRRFIIMIAMYIQCVAFNSVVAQNFSKEQIDVKDCIDNFFQAMYKNDGVTIQQLLFDNARLYTVMEGYGASVLEEFDVMDFIIAVAQPKDEKWNEILWNYTIEVDGAMASVWTDYSFFLESDNNKQLIHCGVNSIELFKSAGGWQITQITDTRKSINCREQ